MIRTLSDLKQRISQYLTNSIGKIDKSTHGSIENDIVDSIISYVNSQEKTVAIIDDQLTRMIIAARIDMMQASVRTLVTIPAGKHASVLSYANGSLAISCSQLSVVGTGTPGHIELGYNRSDTGLYESSQASPTSSIMWSGSFTGPWKMGAGDLQLMVTPSTGFTSHVVYVYFELIY
jgi:hypothetical protein